NDFADKDLALACVQAWNDFILDEWCAAAPEMFVPMTIAPVWDAKLAAAEVLRCAGKGSKALCWVEDTAVLGLPRYHTDAWDAPWSAVQEVDIPICMHIGSGGASTTNFAAMSTPMVEIAVAFTQAARCCINMACSPVLRKFPDLKMVWSEGGIGWLPAAL